MTLARELHAIGAQSITKLLNIGRCLMDLAFAITADLSQPIANYSRPLTAVATAAGVKDVRAPARLLCISSIVGVIILPSAVRVLAEPTTRILLGCYVQSCK